ncbi:hypothetical protein ACFQX6_13330 [Streptosporangium lutulentum]
MVANEARWAFEPWDTFSVTTNRSRPRTPRTQVTYIVPDSEVRWNSGVTTPERPHGYTWPRPETPLVELVDPVMRVYHRAGQKTDLTWFKQPLAPGVNPLSPVRREDDLLFVSMKGFVDASRNSASAYTSDFERGLRTKFKVYKGDELLTETDYTPTGTVALSAERAGYRVEYTVENQATWAKLSTRTGSVWTFTSERAAEGVKTVIPLLLADYDIALDKQNRGNPSSIGLTLYHQAGAAAAPSRTSRWRCRTTTARAGSPYGGSPPPAPGPTGRSSTGSPGATASSPCG